MSNSEELESFGLEPGYQKFELDQNFETMGSAYSGPEQSVNCRAIMRAMIMQIVTDLRGMGIVSTSGEKAIRERRALKEKAQDYILDSSEHTFSFLWICEHLDIDAELFIDGLVAQGILCR